MFMYLHVWELKYQITLYSILFFFVIILKPSCIVRNSASFLGLPPWSPAEHLQWSLERRVTFSRVREVTWWRSGPRAGSWSWMHSQLQTWPCWSQTTGKTWAGRTRPSSSLEPSWWSLNYQNHYIDAYICENHESYWGKPPRYHLLWTSQNKSTSGRIINEFVYKSLSHTELREKLI